MSSSSSTPSPPNKNDSNIDLVGAIALGVGGMMGAGLYTLLGLAAKSSGVLLPIAFLLAGIAGAFSVYSYARLGTAFPSKGGGAGFLLAALGNTTLCAGLNVFQYVAYLIATSLYAAGFAEYVGALAGGNLPTLLSRFIGVGVVVIFTLVNLIGTKYVGRSQKVIIAAELVILVALLALGASHVNHALLTTTPWPAGTGVITGAALLYVTYQGFGVVTNAAGDMGNPKRTLPKAMFSALVIVMAAYLLVSFLVVTLLPIAQIERDAGHVLADVGAVVMGRAGFVVIAAAAILATASAVNATLFACANIASDLATSKQLPRLLARPFRGSSTMALPVSAALVILLVLFFPLDAVGQMTSLAFLIVYGSVSAAHLLVRNQTGAVAWPLVLAVAINGVLFIFLLNDTIRTGSPMTWITFIAALAGSFLLVGLRRSAGSSQGH